MASIKTILANPSNNKTELNNIYSESEKSESRKSIEDILSRNENDSSIDFFTILDDKLAAIRWACLEDLFHTLKYFGEKGADFHELDLTNNSYYYNNSNCIHWASEGGSIRVLEFLIDKNINLFQKTTNGDNGLIIAAHRNHQKVIEKLLDCGLDVNESDTEKRTPLILASTEGFKDLVEYLVKNGADIHLKDKYDRSALHYACQGGHKEILEFLIQKDANILFQLSFFATCPTICISCRC